MKALKIALAGAIMALSAPAYAQSADDNGTNKGYRRISIDYVNRTISPDYDDTESYSTNGVGSTLLRGISVSKKIPIFIEYGIGFDYGHWSKSGGSEFADYYKASLNTFACNVPVNLAYKFDISGGVSITPYLGVNFRVNALARMKKEYNDVSYDWNMFDKDLDKDERWKIFQAGWHIGAGVNFHKLYLGINYGTDFNAICKDTNTSTLMVSLGINL